MISDAATLTKKTRIQRIGVHRVHRIGELEAPENAKVRVRPISCHRSSATHRARPHRGNRPPEPEGLRARDEEHAGRAQPPPQHDPGRRSKRSQSDHGRPVRRRLRAKRNATTMIDHLKLVKPTSRRALRKHHRNSTQHQSEPATGRLLGHVLRHRREVARVQAPRPVPPKQQPSHGEGPENRREDSSTRRPPNAKAARSPRLPPAKSAQLQPPVEKRPPPVEAAEADLQSQEEASAREEEEANPRTPRNSPHQTRSRQVHDPAFERARPRQHKQHQ